MGQLEMPSVPPDLGWLCVNTIFLLLGVYGSAFQLAKENESAYVAAVRWEYVQSLHLECALVCTRLAFRALLIPYVLGRASLFVFLILLVVGTSPFAKGVSCLPGTLAIVSLGAITLGCCSTNFVIRTWVIWKDSRLVCAFLLLLALGQWILLVVDVAIVKSIDIDCICAVNPNYPLMNAVTLMYTTCFDLLVFVLSVVGLSNQPSASPLKKRLLSQGILYFAVAGITYIPAMVSALLNSTPVYNLVCNIAITISTIVSSRAVRSLHEFDTPPPNSSSEASDIELTSHIDVPRSTTVHESVRGRRRVDADEAANRC